MVAAFVEALTGPDGSPVGPEQPWQHLAGAMRIMGSSARGVDTSVHRERCLTPLDGPNMKVACRLSAALPSVGSSYSGIGVRFDEDEDTGYLMSVVKSATGATYRIDRVVTGLVTAVMTAPASAHVDGQAYQLEAVDYTITARKVADGLQVIQFTDDQPILIGNHVALTTKAGTSAARVGTNVKGQLVATTLPGAPVDPRRRERVVVWEGVDADGDPVTGETTAVVYTRPRDVLLDLGDPGRDEDQTTAFINQLVEGTTNHLPAGDFRMDSVLAGGQLASINKRDCTIEGGGRWVDTLVTPDTPDGVRWEPGFRMWTDRWGYDLGCVDQNGNSLRAHLTVGLASRRLTIRGIDIEGPMTGRSAERPKFGLFLFKTCFEHALRTDGGAEDITWEHMRYKNVGGDAKYVGGGLGPVKRAKFYRASGTYAGRQIWGLDWFDGLHAIECIDDWAARSGWDEEPYVRENRYTVNSLAERCIFGCLFNGINLAGDEDAPADVEGELLDFPNRRMNNAFVDCSIRNALSSRNAVLANRGGIGLTIVRLTDLRNRSANAILLRGWHNSFIDQAEVSSGFASTAATVGVQYDGCSGVHELYRSKFNEPTATSPNSHGAKAIYVVNSPEADFVLRHGGNQAGQGGILDGPDPRLLAA